MKRKTMVGKFFLRFTAEGKMSWQGVIVGEPNKGVYLCQLYEWITGGATEQVLMKLEDMTHWKLYDYVEDRNTEAQRQMRLDAMKARLDDESPSNESVPN